MGGVCPNRTANVAATVRAGFGVELHEGAEGIVMVKKLGAAFGKITILNRSLVTCECRRRPLSIQRNLVALYEM